MTSTRFLVEAPTLAVMFGGTAVWASDKDGTARQQELDAACERARTKRLAADRRKLPAECVASVRGSQTVCEAEYSHYGERAGNRPPLYSDLPQYKASINFQTSTRSTR